MTRKKVKIDKINHKNKIFHFRKIDKNNHENDIEFIRPFSDFSESNLNLLVRSTGNCIVFLVFLIENPNIEDSEITDVEVLEV